MLGIQHVSDSVDQIRGKTDRVVDAGPTLLGASLEKGFMAFINRYAFQGDRTVRSSTQSIIEV